MKISESFFLSKEDPAYGINMLLGKIIKGSGLKLTDEGVIYEEKLSVDNHQSKVGDILILDEDFELFNFLEMDPGVFYSGFETVEQMFAFVATSPYLKSDEFTDSNKKFTHPIFENFRRYLLYNCIVSLGKNITYEYIDSFVEFDFFEALEALKQKERRKKEIVTKFNGRVILNKFPDFDKKYLSKAMGDFKYSFGSKGTYDEFILSNSTGLIMNKFKEFVKF